jgi:Spherulation-specific family 4
MMKKSAMAMLPVLGLLLSACQSNATSVTPAAIAPLAQRPAASTVPTGIVIPMYVNPGPVWNDVIVQKRAHPNVPILLIADVTNTGVGGSKLRSYATYIQKEQAAGVSVIGYVATGYGHSSISFIETQMSRWYGYYHVNGIFLDEMNPNDPSLYRTVTTFAHAHSLPLVMGNPGENAAGNSGPDVINFWEQKGYPPLSYLKQSPHVAYGKARWSYMAGAVQYDAATITASAPYVAYIYATDGKEVECYCKLPSYFSQLVALLATLDPG